MPEPQDEPEAAGPTVPSAYVVATAAILASAALYASTFSLGLFSDDFVFLAPQCDILPEEQWPYFRPLPVGTMRLLDGLLGDPAGPAALHGLAVVLHGLNAALLFVLGRRLDLGPQAALLAAAAFLAFPASVEAVVWVSALPDVFVVTSSLVFLLACLAEGGAARRVLVGGVVTIAALCSKEVAVAVPLIALVLLAGRLDRIGSWLVGSSLAVAVLFACWRLAQGGESVVEARLLTPMVLKNVVVRPFAALAVPWTRTEITASPWVAVLAAVGIVTLLTFVSLRRRGHVALAWRAASCALIGALPLLSMFYVDDFLQGSRYLYLPSIGWALLMAACVESFAAEWPRRRWVTATAGALLVAVGSTGVSTHLADWQSAARARDAQLAEASRKLREGRRDALPAPLDSVGGAYVFRNGFMHAMVRREGCSTVRQRTSLARLPD